VVTACSASRFAPSRLLRGDRFGRRTSRGSLCREQVRRYFARLEEQSAGLAVCGLCLYVCPTEDVIRQRKDELFCRLHVRDHPNVLTLSVHWLPTLNLLNSLASLASTLDACR